MTLADRIKRDEGWRDRPYPDPIHGWDVPTFGYGFTYITKDEGERILHNRIRAASQTAQNFATTEVWNDMSRIRQDVLIEMSYNTGIWAFRRLRAALYERDWGKAAHEIRDSKAYRQFQQLNNPRWESFAQRMESGVDDE